MNVPSQTEILLLTKIPVVLDLIEFEIFTGRLDLTSRFQNFLGEQLPQETPRGLRLWRSQYFPLLRNIHISTNTLLKPKLRARCHNQAFLPSYDQQKDITFHLNSFDNCSIVVTTAEAVSKACIQN